MIRLTTRRSAPLSLHIINGRAGFTYTYIRGRAQDKIPDVDILSPIIAYEQVVYQHDQPVPDDFCEFKGQHTVVIKKERQNDNAWPSCYVDIPNETRSEFNTILLREGEPRITESALKYTFVNSVGILEHKYIVPSETYPFGSCALEKRDFETKCMFDAMDHEVHVV